MTEILERNAEPGPVEAGID